MSVVDRNTLLDGTSPLANHDDSLTPFIDDKFLDLITRWQKLTTIDQHFFRHYLRNASLVDPATDNCLVSRVVCAALILSEAGQIFWGSLDSDERSTLLSTQNSKELQELWGLSSNDQQEEMITLCGEVVGGLPKEWGVSILRIAALDPSLGKAVLEYVQCFGAGPVSLKQLHTLTDILSRCSNRSRIRAPMTHLLRLLSDRPFAEAHAILEHLLASGGKLERFLIITKSLLYAIDERDEGGSYCVERDEAAELIHYALLLTTLDGKWIKYHISPDTAIDEWRGVVEEMRPTSQLTTRGRDRLVGDKQLCGDALGKVANHIDNAGLVDDCIDLFRRYEIAYDPNQTFRENLVAWGSGKAETKRDKIFMHLTRMVYRAHTDPLPHLLRLSTHVTRSQFLTLLRKSFYWKSSATLCENLVRLDSILRRRPYLAGLSLPLIGVTYATSLCGLEIIETWPAHEAMTFLHYLHDLKAEDRLIAIRALERSTSLVHLLVQIDEKWGTSTLAWAHQLSLPDEKRATLRKLLEPAMRDMIYAQSICAAARSWLQTDESLLTFLLTTTNRTRTERRRLFQFWLYAEPPVEVSAGNRLLALRLQDKAFRLACGDSGPKDHRLFSGMTTLAYLQLLESMTSVSENWASDIYGKLLDGMTNSQAGYELIRTRVNNALENGNFRQTSLDGPVQRATELAKLLSQFSTKELADEAISLFTIEEKALAERLITRLLIIKGFLREPEIDLDMLEEHGEVLVRRSAQHLLNEADELTEEAVLFTIHSALLMEHTQFLGTCSVTGAIRSELTCRSGLIRMRDKLLDHLEDETTAHGFSGLIEGKSSVHPLLFSYELTYLDRYQQNGPRVDLFQPLVDKIAGDLDRSTRRQLSLRLGNEVWWHIVSDETYELKYRLELTHRTRGPLHKNWPETYDWLSTTFSDYHLELPSETELLTMAPFKVTLGPAKFDFARYRHRITIDSFSQAVSNPKRRAKFAHGDWPGAGNLLDFVCRDPMQLIRHLQGWYGQFPSVLRQEILDVPGFAVTLGVPAHLMSIELAPILELADLEGKLRDFREQAVFEDDLVALSNHLCEQFPRSRAGLSLLFHRMKKESPLSIQEVAERLNRGLGNDYSAHRIYSIESAFNQALYTDDRFEHLRPPLFDLGHTNMDHGMRLGFRFAVGRHEAQFILYNRGKGEMIDKRPTPLSAANASHHETPTVLDAILRALFSKFEVGSA